MKLIVNFGAGGTIGTISVARSEPDGYTVLFDSPEHIIAPLLQPGITINYETAFSYISGVTEQPWVWIVADKFPATDLQWRGSGAGRGRG